MPQQTEAEGIPETILQDTMVLIQEGRGDAAQITTRAIAARAGVAPGLINYHFQTKENLITLCVQRMIRQVVVGYQPPVMAGESDRLRLRVWASGVFGFLFENPGLSRLSILADLTADAPQSNTRGTRLGLMGAMQTEVFPENRPLLAFLLVCAMQCTFLCPAGTTEALGMPLQTVQERNAWVERVVDALWYGLAAQSGAKQEILPEQKRGEEA